MKNYHLQVFSRAFQVSVLGLVLKKNHLCSVPRSVLCDTCRNMMPHDSLQLSSSE